jgi:acetyl-CoA carboxylase biotin carboxyl carrier protein
MAKNPPGPTEPLDVARVRYLVRLMKRYDLTALDVIDGAVQIRLRRRGPQTAVPQAPPPLHALDQAVANPGPSSPAPPRSESHPTAVSASPKTVVIESPMVGTYYSSSAPDAPAYVAVGAVVQPDTIVCIIEAMKVFTDIPAGVSGTIAAILVNNGQAVEYGQPLFRVIPG